MNENENEGLLDGEDMAVKSVGANQSANPGLQVVEMGGEAVDDVMGAGRAQAFDRLGYYWQGKELLPYSSSRDSLFVRLRKEMGSPSLTEALGDLSLFTADAQLILWLCSHDLPEISKALRGDVLAEIWEWVDVNVPRVSAGEAVDVALDIFNDSKMNDAESAPDEDGLAGKLESGN